MSLPTGPIPEITPWQEGGGDGLRAWLNGLRAYIVSLRTTGLTYIVTHTGSSWPSRPSIPTGSSVHWIGGANPPGDAVAGDLWTKDLNA